MKPIALILCAIAALGASTVCFAQGAVKAPGAGAAGVVGTAQAVDETALAIGDAGVAPAAGAAAAGTNTLAYFVRMVLVLALVVVAIYLVVRFIRKLSRPKLGDEASIKVLASASLGSGRAVHVVSLGSKAYLLGAADSSVSLIAEIGDKEYVDALALKAASSPGGGASFSQLLGSMLGGRGRSRSGRGGADYLAGQRERLRKL